MCAVPNIAVFCSSSTSWFPGMSLTYFLNDLEMVPVAPIIIIIIIIILCKLKKRVSVCTRRHFSSPILHKNVSFKFYTAAVHKIDGANLYPLISTVPGSIPGGVTWDFFHGSFQLNHVPWGWIGFWKWVPGISPGVKADGAFGWRTTTLVVPKFEKIRGP